MLSYPPETTITNIENYVLLVFPHGKPVRFWQYRVNKLVCVRGQVVDTQFIGSGVEDTKAEAEAAAGMVHQQDVSREPGFEYD